jgi:23S rRNA pseudouridine2605 synthase
MRKVRIGSRLASLGDHVTQNDEIYLEGKRLILLNTPLTIMLHKPVGYVCSRRGQGSKTVYDLLPAELHNLKPVGRLDKDSSGLLILTNDGQLAHELMHPKFNKTKIYQVTIDRPITDKDKAAAEKGVQLSDGLSRLKITNVIASTQKLNHKSTRLPDTHLTISLSEGRNRQIRRTFSKLGYKVIGLHRTKFSDIMIGDLKAGKYKKITT